MNINNLMMIADCDLPEDKKEFFLSILTLLETKKDPYDNWVFMNIEDWRTKKKKGKVEILTHGNQGSWLEKKRNRNMLSNVMTEVVCQVMTEEYAKYSK